MKNKHYEEILESIKKNSGKKTKHTDLDNYLGTTHPRYPITVPLLRLIAKGWMKNHPELTSTNFASLLSSLIKADSSTEKCMAGIYCTMLQKNNVNLTQSFFDSWLNELEGWAEIDTLCTSKYTLTEIENQW